MGSFITWTKLAFSLTPVIIEAIKAIEAAIPGQGKGEQKLAIIRAAFEQTQGLFDSVDPGQAWNMIESLVGRFVSIFNATGVFKK